MDEQNRSSMQTDHSIKKQLMHEIAPSVVSPHAKVSIVGCGQVGMACAFSMMIRGICSEIALVDVDENRLQGEMLDLQHGQAFVKKVSIKSSSDYAVTAGSRVCVITAGARQQEGESRLDLVQKNVSIFKKIVPSLVKHSPRCIILVVSNPVDILTYVAWKLSGLPANRVFGSGTTLDSSRFRVLLSERFDVAPSSVHGWIVGEHGDTSVPVWSGVNIAGVNLRELSPNIGTSKDPEDWESIHQQVVDSAYKIITLKGYTSWAIGLMVTALTDSVLRNHRNLFAVSTLVKGFYDIKDNVFLSLPAALGENGVTHIIKMKLNEEETKNLKKSAATIREVQTSIKFK